MIVYLKNQSNYKMKDFEGMSYDEIRPIFEKVWDFNHNFVPMDLEIEKEKKKPAEFQEIEEEQIEKDTSKKTTGKRKKYLPRRRTRSTAKKQKVEQDDEKEELTNYLRYEFQEKMTYTLSENFMYYKIIRGDGSSKNYKILSEMLYDFDRQDVVELYRLVKERYSSSKPEGYDLMLWGDLHTLFEPDEESEIWMNQNEYNLISWSLCDFCGVHILLMQNGIAIHMLTEKKYPLSQEMISKMLSKRLKVDQESTQAYELLKFIRSQVNHKFRGGLLGINLHQELIMPRPIRRIQDFDESKDHCITLKNTSYPHQRYAVYNTLVNKEEQAGFTQYAISIKKIRRINALALSDRYLTYHETSSDRVKMDNPNITIEECIRLEEEKARRHGKVYNWETATYGKICDNENVHDLGSVETEFPDITFNDMLTSEATLSYEPTNEFPSIVYNDAQTSKLDDLDYFKDFENEFLAIVYNDAQTSKLDDLDYFKDFENEFLAIVYNDAQTSKSDLSTKLILNPQHIDEFNLKDETSLFECDEEEQNVLNFNDQFPFNVIYLNDSKSDKDNDDNKVDIEHSSGDLSVKPLPDVINN
ncbi:hypothetical protein Tco_0900774, partial [Tanacetum coccineum]